MKALWAVLILLSLLGGAGTSRADQAMFAGGCFWCMEAAFQDLVGVEDVVSGFTGGTLKNPTYRGNHAGHYEAIAVTYDTSLVSYEDLLAIYWVNVDPFDNGGQFCDRGHSYRSAVFARPEQLTLAQQSKARVVQRFPGETVYTEILPASTFYAVEESHQDYYKKNPIRYAYYKTGCRRERRLEQVWGDDAGH